MAQPFIVEISRIVERVEYARGVVWAETAEEAHRLAQPLAKAANDSATWSADFPFSTWTTDGEGETHDWEAQTPQEPSDFQDLDSADDFDAINEPVEA